MLLRCVLIMARGEKIKTDENLKRKLFVLVLTIMLLLLVACTVPEVAEEACSAIVGRAGKNDRNIHTESRRAALQFVVEKASL